MIRNTLCIIAITLAATVSSVSITTPGVCISNVECQRTEFCERAFFAQVPRCTLRQPEVVRCTKLGLGECPDGLTCVFDDTIRADGPTCQPRAVRGATCNPNSPRPCVDDLICERNTTTCQPFTDGFAGTPCFLGRHCQQDKGFYCHIQPGVCAPKRREGAACNRASGTNACFGFCLSRSSNDGVCIRSRKEGEECTDSRHCDNPFFGTFEPGSDPLVCNLPKGLIGRCMRESNLINRLGVRCNPSHDRCNARRGLSCRPDRNGKNVCQHRRSRFESPFGEYCEPRSRFSRCTWRAERQECRVARLLPGQYGPFGVSPFLMCRRKLERIPRGGVCIREFAACTSGTECRLVAGVKAKSMGFGRFRPNRVAFCVRIAKENEFCGDVKEKFTTQCDEGLRCGNGKCVKAEINAPPVNETITHLGLGALCTDSDLPCAPGLVCDTTEFDPEQRCILPLRTVSKGKACSDRATERRRCAEGLVCAFRKDGTNIKRCREPRKAGEYCEFNECEKGLACPVFVTGEREQEESRCYDPEKALRIGERCDPRPNAEARCVEHKRPDPFHPSSTSRQAMRCVRKGRRFVCRVLVGLFEFCDEERDIACDDGLKCGNLGVCVPERE